jgi:hypothetical protein
VLKREKRKEKKVKFTPEEGKHKKSDFPDEKWYNSRSKKRRKSQWLL